MTNREKFIEVFGDNPQRHHITKSWWDEEYVPPVKPQEPFNIDTYCKEHFMVMVDKIRAEIKQLPIYGAKFLNGYFTVHVDVDEVLQIIDKYRGEVDCRECKAEYECYECKKYEESEDKENVF